MTKSALLIDEFWCKKIVRGQKTWEIRSKPCKKRGRVILASTAKTSPGGKALQLGEATLTDCIVVARKNRGFISAPCEASGNFMFLKEHISKHGNTNLSDFPVLRTYETVYAWIFCDPVQYSQPKLLPFKPGCVVWVKV